MPITNVIMQTVEYNEDDSVTVYLYRVGPEHQQTPWDQRSPIACDTAKLIAAALPLADDRAGQPMCITGVGIACYDGIALASVDFQNEADDSDDDPDDGLDEDEDDDFIAFTLLFDLLGVPLAVETLEFKSERDFEKNMPEYKRFAID